MAEKLENSKIVIFHDYLTSFGGAERILEGMIRAYPESTICTSKILQEKFKGSLIETHYKSGKIKESIFFKYFKIEDSYIDLHRKLSFFVFLLWNFYEYDIIILNTSGAVTWNLLLNFTNKKIFTYYHKIVSIDFFGAKNILESVYSILNQYFVKSLEKLITNSNFNKLNFVQKYNLKENNIKVIYPFISETSSEYISKFENCTKEPYFVFIGRLERYKGIVELMQICNKHKFKLKIIGSGELESQISTNDNIEYLGNVSDERKFEILSKAKALISLGGVREEFGIIYLESLMCKTPFISLNSGGALEIGTPETAIFINKSEELENILCNFDKYNFKFSTEFLLNLRNKYSIGRFVDELKSAILI
jgi:glycosyltransferase involved in cell wall biosynthesis